MAIAYTRGVSNTRPTRCIVAARKHPKNRQNYKFWSNLAYIEGVLVNCGPQKLFSTKLRPAEHFFLEYEFEFETPGLHGRKLKLICENWVKFSLNTFKFSDTVKMLNLVSFRILTHDPWTCWRFALRQKNHGI